MRVENTDLLTVLEDSDEVQLPLVEDPEVGRAGLGVVDFAPGGGGEAGGAQPVQLLLALLLQLLH